MPRSLPRFPFTLEPFPKAPSLLEKPPVQRFVNKEPDA